MRRLIRGGLAAAFLCLAGAGAATEPPGGVPLPPRTCQRACLEG